MEIRPDFYDDFACLADRCRHSCCRGWEIELDEETAGFYRSLDGPLGEALRENLTRMDGVWAFRLTAEEACPFLRGDGLCRIIIELGEDALCDTCTLHPRFFEDVGEHVLSGVGASCEGVAALLLGATAPLTFLTDSGEALTLRGLLAALGCELPAEELRYAPAVDAPRWRELLALYACCEAIDDDWTADLAALAADGELPARASACAERCDAHAYQRIFDYIVYRQLERLETDGAARVLRFARAAADFIFLCDVHGTGTAESLRRWSAEVEYSTENVELLFDKLH